MGRWGFWFVGLSTHVSLYTWDSMLEHMRVLSHGGDGVVSDPCGTYRLMTSAATNACTRDSISTHKQAPQWGDGVFERGEAHDIKSTVVVYLGRLEDHLATVDTDATSL